jgi:hypothetical protein
VDPHVEILRERANNMGYDFSTTKRLCQNRTSNMWILGYLIDIVAYVATNDLQQFAIRFNMKKIEFILRDMLL